MNLKQVTTILLALVAIYAPAKAQQDVTVNDHHYQVTSMMKSRNGDMLRIVDTANPQRMAVVQVNGGDVKLLAPNFVDDATMKEIKDVVSAYKNSNGGAAATQPAQPPADDQAAKLRQQSLELQQQALQRAAVVTGQQSGQPAKLTADFPAGGGAVVHGTPYGDIVFNQDATEAHFTRTSSNALAGNTEQTWEYDYVGKKNAAGALAKGVGGALAGAFDVRHAGRVDGGGIHVLVETNGEKPHEVYGTEQKTFAVNPYVRNPLDNGERQLAVNFLDAAKQALQTASDAAKNQNVETFRPDPDVFTELFDKWKHKL
jgi:hypothetical protein